MAYETLLTRIGRGEVLLCDGATGTMLHERGLQPGECPDSWCISHPEVVKSVAEAYALAGSDIVETNSFGATAFKLKPYGLADKVSEINRAAVALAKAAIGDRGYVAGSIGPTGHILTEEGGDASSAEFYEAFKEQAVALADAGADFVLIETMSSLLEALQAIKAAKENTQVPVACTFTFQKHPKGYRTMMGLTPERAAKQASAAGADIVGANCSSGIDDMIEVSRQMRGACPALPIFIQPNAGAPVLENGKTVFKQTPEHMASCVPELLLAGANIVGGCCGTTPNHIAAMARVIRARIARAAL
jgi:5-methyltetrahydrofolate--homocysteine methyltransferase